MLYSLYLQLGFRDLKRTTMSLQLVDISIKYGKGMVDNFLLQVDTLILHVDFVMLDMEENLFMNKKTYYPSC